MKPAGRHILVCGGRDYSDRGTLFAVLDRVHRERGVALIIHGAASGADFLADEWAEGYDILVARFPADWKRHGRAAGPIHNAQMIVEGKPDAVVAFPGGPGHGGSAPAGSRRRAARVATCGWTLRLVAALVACAESARRW